MPERRRVPRTRVFKSAKIISSKSVRDCIVRDISKFGACLALISTTSIPDIFELTFDAGRTLRPCRAAWRTATEIGVEFEEDSFRAAACALSHQPIPYRRSVEPRRRVKTSKIRDVIFTYWPPDLVLGLLARFFGAMCQTAPRLRHLQQQCLFLRR